MFEIHWNALPDFLDPRGCLYTEQWETLTETMRYNFENILENESRQPTRFKVYSSLQCVRDNVIFMLSISHNKCISLHS